MRLGYINYLNLLPVYYGFETGRTPFEGELVTGPPTRVNEYFRHREVDVAPISSIEFARGPETDALLPGLCISARGHVQSILLFSRRPPADLGGGTVAWTASSATSVVLAKVLLARYWRVAVDYRTQPPDLDGMLEGADGALLIGDDALRAGLRLGVLPWSGEGLTRTVLWHDEPLHVTDLGAAWFEHTGLPMVYAVFAAHRESAPSVPLVRSALRRSREEALRDPEGLLQWASGKTGLSTELVDVYLNQVIRHDLGVAELAGLKAFYAEAAAVGELTSVPPLRVIEV